MINKFERNHKATLTCAIKPPLAFYHTTTSCYFTIYPGKPHYFALLRTAMIGYVRCVTIEKSRCYTRLHNHCRFGKNKKYRFSLKISILRCFAFLRKWCYQKMSCISKWLYIFVLKNRNKRNLPLLLHLISAPFCSVSQSRIPTLMQS